MTLHNYYKTEKLVRVAMLKNESTELLLKKDKGAIDCIQQFSSQYEALSKKEKAKVFDLSVALEKILKARKK